MWDMYKMGSTKLVVQKGSCVNRVALNKCIPYTFPDDRLCTF